MKIYFERFVSSLLLSNLIFVNSDKSRLAVLANINSAIGKTSYPIKIIVVPTAFVFYVLRFGHGIESYYYSIALVINEICSGDNKYNETNKFPNTSTLKSLA